MLGLALVAALTVSNLPVRGTPIEVVHAIAVPPAARTAEAMPDVVDPKGAYSNVTTAAGTAYRPGPTGGAGTGSTYTMMDDLTFALPSQLSCQTIRLDIYNANTAAVTARVLLRFWNDSAGSIGNYYLDPVTTVPVGFVGTLTFPAGPSHAVYTLVLAPAGFAVPAGTTTLWVGVQFDNTGTTATPAEIEGLGQGLYDPPDVGTSGNQFYRTTSTADSFAVNAPAGGYYWFGGTPVANFGWELVFPALPVELVSFTAE